MIIATLIYENTFFIKTNKTKEDINDMTKRFVLDILGDGLCCIAFIIYLEIIELKFCGCNYNLKKNISQRADSEVIYSLDGKDSLLCINRDIEKELNEIN